MRSYYKEFKHLYSYNRQTDLVAQTIEACIQDKVIVSNRDFRFLDIGFSQRATVLMFWLIAALFGATTLFLQSKEKLVALSVLAILTIAFTTRLVVKYKHETKH